MKVLSPSKLYPDHCPQRGGVWYRLTRTDDGILCLEEISDATLNRSGPPAPWAFAGELPPHLARQCVDDENPDIVAAVLSRSVRFMIENVWLGDPALSARAKEAK